MSKNLPIPGQSIPGKQHVHGAASSSSIAIGSMVPELRTESSSSSSEASQLPLVTSLTDPRASPLSAGISPTEHSFITAMNELQSRDVLRYTINEGVDKHQQRVLRAEADLELDGRPFKLHSEFPLNQNSSWCQNKCLKHLLRQVSIVNQDADKLYRQLDPKLRFFRNELVDVEEGQQVEFKGSRKINTPMEYNTAKNVAIDSSVGHTVCAFLNSYLGTGQSAGGSVFIGIHDDGFVHGVANLASQGWSLTDELQSHAASEWTIKEFKVKVDDIVREGQVICSAVNKRGLQVDYRSLYEGKITALANKGRVPLSISSKKIPDYISIVDLNFKAPKMSNQQVFESSGVQGVAGHATTASASSTPAASADSTTIKDLKSVIVQGVEMTRADRDSLPKAIQQHLLAVIEPSPRHHFNVFLHPVDEKPSATAPPFRHGEHLLKEDVAYIENLEGQIKKLQDKLRALENPYENLYVIEIRVRAADRLHFHKGRPYERNYRHGAETTAISVEDMKRYILLEGKKRFP